MHAMKSTLYDEMLAYQLQHNIDDKEAVQRACGESLNNKDSFYGQKQQRVGELCPVGLGNPGNACYMNATMQALLAIPSFKEVFVEINSDQKKAQQMNKPLNCFFDEYFRATQTMSAAQITLMYGNIFADQSNYFDFSVMRQSDAGELLQWLMQLGQNDVLYKEFIKKMLPTQTTTIECCSCGHKSIRSGDPLFPLSISISVRDSACGTDLAYCLSQYFVDKGILPDYKCNNCYKETCKNQDVISNKPSVVCIQLKRFEYDNKTNVRNKIKTPVQIPINHSILVNNENIDYELKSVIMHEGTLDSGHYTSLVNYGCDWYECNDSLITLIDIKAKLNEIDTQKKVYILFYEKCEQKKQSSLLPKQHKVLQKTLPSGLLAKQDIVTNKTKVTKSKKQQLFANFWHQFVSLIWV